MIGASNIKSVSNHINAHCSAVPGLNLENLNKMKLIKESIKSKMNSDIKTILITQFSNSLWPGKPRHGCYIKTIETPNLERYCKKVVEFKSELQKQYPETKILYLSGLGRQLARCRTDCQNCIQFPKFAQDILTVDTILSKEMDIISCFTTSKFHNVQELNRNKEDICRELYFYTKFFINCPSCEIKGKKTDKVHFCCQSSKDVYVTHFNRTLESIRNLQ